MSQWPAEEPGCDAQHIGSRGVVIADEVVAS